MKYLSLCSGIEAATVAWHPLGWEAVAYSEIERFPSEVLAYHYPNTPNLGDMTKFKEWSIESNVDLLVGGTPCQSFSVAGLRKGLDDPRGNLMLTYLAIADQYKPKWIVWENVPGVLSSNGGKDFGVFLGALGELGYGFAYRILDAQYFGVAQRRRRVFVVGYLGDWRCAAAVLFERESLSGNPAPSREKGQSFTASIGAGPVYGGSDPNTADTVTSKWAKGSGGPAGNECGLFVAQPIASHDVAGTMLSRNTSGGFSNSIDHAAGGYMAMQPIPIHDQATRHAGKNGNKTMGKGNGLGIGKPGDPMNTLTKGDHHAVAQPIAFSRNDDGRDVTYDLAPTMRVAGNAGGMLAAAIGTDIYNGAITGDVAVPLTNRADGTGTGPTVMQSMAVRRLTPVECERLQGFPDTYTDIMSKGKATPDGPRYKALGNSMAVPVMAWIGKRIQEVEEICKPNK